MKIAKLSKQIQGKVLEKMSVMVRLLKLKTPKIYTYSKAELNLLLKHGLVLKHGHVWLWLYLEEIISRILPNKGISQRRAQE